MYARCVISIWIFFKTITHQSVVVIVCVWKVHSVYIFSPINQRLAADSKLTNLNIVKMNCVNCHLGVKTVSCSDMTLCGCVDVFCLYMSCCWFLIFFCFVFKQVLLTDDYIEQMLEDLSELSASPDEVNFHCNIEVAIGFWVIIIIVGILIIIVVFFADSGS